MAHCSSSHRLVDTWGPFPWCTWMSFFSDLGREGWKVRVWAPPPGLLPATTAPPRARGGRWRHRSGWRVCRRTSPHPEAPGWSEELLQEEEEVNLEHDGKREEEATMFRVLTFHCNPGSLRGEGQAVELHLTPVLTRILLLDRLHTETDHNIRPNNSHTAPAQHRARFMRALDPRAEGSASNICTSRSRKGPNLDQRVEWLVLLWR